MNNKYFFLILITSSLHAAHAPNSPTAHARKMKKSETSSNLYALSNNKIMVRAATPQSAQEKFEREQVNPIAHQINSSRVAAVTLVASNNTNGSTFIPIYRPKAVNNTPKTSTKTNEPLDLRTGNKENQSTNENQFEDELEQVANAMFGFDDVTEN